MLVLGKIRTLNPQIRSLILYPIEPQARREFLFYIKNNIPVICKNNK